jgi:hypothetical protein
MAEVELDIEPIDDIRLALLAAVPINDKRSRRLVACSAERSLDVSIRLLLSESEFELDGGLFSSIDEDGTRGGGIFND